MRSGLCPHSASASRLATRRRCTRPIAPSASEVSTSIPDGSGITSSVPPLTIIEHTALGRLIHDDGERRRITALRTTVVGDPDSDGIRARAVGFRRSPGELATLDPACCTGS